MTVNRLELFPLTVQISKKSDHLTIGGCDCTDLLKKYGSPLYVFDEATIRSICREFAGEFGSRHRNCVVAYASKAFISRPLAKILKEEGLGMDTVSGGEISVAQSVDFPADKVFFHGNNKSENELKMALDWGLGRIAVDNFYELELLNRLAAGKPTRANILLRLNPSVDPHTHRHTTTGILDSKFGFPIGTGQAEKAVKSAMSMKNISLKGLHFHLGSPIDDTEPYRQGMEIVLKFAAEMKSRYSFIMHDFSPGGGFAVRYTTSSEIPPVSAYAETITGQLAFWTSRLGLAKPRLIVEPGRSIIAKAGVALYTIGSIKEIPEVRTYVCVDGGMGDNIRPALYESKYEAVLANKVTARPSKKITIAGRYCESGDILIKDIAMPEIASGDIIAIPVCGAYCIPMSSNYNMVPHPAIAMVKDGKARIIRKRQKYSDLMKYDVMGKA
ncbi:MAG: diaminopimelate decarboxylase [Dehalococcoidia bacterium]|jgi:diaminopimelate decarboxylase